MKQVELSGVELAEVKKLALEILKVLPREQKASLCILALQWVSHELTQQIGFEAEVLFAGQKLDIN